MKIFKKVIAGVAALAIAVSGIGLGAVSRKEAKAAALTVAPDGTEEVIASVIVADDDEKKTVTSAWGDLGSRNLSNLNDELLADPNVYVKITVSGLGNVDGDDGEMPFEDAMSWAILVKYYNNWSAEFEVEFKAVTGSTADRAVGYAPASDFVLDEWGQISGNVSCGHAKGATLESIELVRVETKTYYETVIKNEEAASGKDIILQNGIDFNRDFLSEDAKLKVYLRTEEGDGLASGWGIGQIGYGESWWDSTGKVADISSAGPNQEFSVTIPFSSFPVGENIGMKTWAAGSFISKISIMDTAVPATGVAFAEDSYTFKIGSDKAATPASVTPVVTVIPADTEFKSYTLTSGDEEVAKIVNGKIVPVGVGETTITVTTDFGGFTDTCEVIVEAVKPAAITISGAQTDTVKGGDVVSLETEIAPDNAVDKTVVWTSSDTAVATVDANGKVTFANVAETKTVKITATSNADPSVKAEITFTVEKLVIDNPVTGVTISNKNLELKKGETGELSATVAPEDASLKTVTWSSSDESVATVDSDGKVTAVGMGTATITVKTVDGEKTDSCEVTITAPSAESVTVIVNGEEIEADEEDGKFKLSIMEGRKRNLTVSALPEDAVQKFTFISSDDSVVTVDEDGNLVAVAVGEAVITVTADGASKEIEITVTEKSNVPYVTDEGTVIFDGEETTAGIWDPAAACREYFKQDGSLDFSIITEDSVIKAYYTSDKAPQLVLQKYNDENLNWVKVAPYLVEDGVAYFSYEDMVKAFGDLTVADALYISADGAVITVTKVVVAEKAETDNGSVSVDAKGEFKPAIEMSKEEVIDAIKNVLSKEQLAAIEDGTAKIEIELNVANIDATVSQEDKDIIADALKNIADSDKLNFMVMNYLDITFGANVDGEVIKISETDGMITISVSLDKAVNGTYKVVRIHDGKAEVIDSELSEDGTKLTFKTDKFSTYAIVFADVASGETVPVTLIALLALALAAAVIVTAAVKKAAKQN